MESVVIATPRMYEAQIRSRLAKVGTVTLGAAGALVVEDAGSRVYVVRNDDIPDELEPERMRTLVAIVADPEFYAVEFSDLAHCKKVLAAVADDPCVAVDNDHGVVLSGRDFVARLRQQPGWDWRGEP